MPNGSESTDDEIIEPAQMLELTWAQTSRRPTASRKPRRRRGRSRQQEGTVSSLEGSSGSFNVSSSASWETFVDATDAMCLRLLNAAALVQLVHTQCVGMQLFATFSRMRR